MKVSIVGQTQAKQETYGFGNIKSAEIFSGKAAAVCYMSKTFEEISNEPEEKILKRLERCKTSGHHSVMDHYYFTLLIEDCPKILAMILNNEKEYATSEKSARYTKMKTEGKEKELYEKWISIFEKEILKKYENKLDEKQAIKLAQENARYLISIFTPATTMLYSTSWRQIQYIMNWMEKFNFEKTYSDLFNNKLIEEKWKIFGNKLNDVFKEFTNALKELGFSKLDDGKNRTFSLFSCIDLKEDYFDVTYSTSYIGTFSELAQLQRHRTIYYNINIVKTKEKFYIPEIIKNTDLEKEWINDIKYLELEFPQGTLIKINERGNIENFILKCEERLCSRVQLETAKQTAQTLEKYYKNVINNTNNNEIKNMLSKFVEKDGNAKARCQSGYKCKDGCIFGPNNFKNRII